MQHIRHYERVLVPATGQDKYTVQPKWWTVKNRYTVGQKTLFLPKIIKVGFDPTTGSHQALREMSVKKSVSKTVSEYDGLSTTHRCIFL